MRNKKFLEESLLFENSNTNTITRIQVAIKNDKTLQRIILFKKTKERKIFVNIVKKEKIKLEFRDYYLIDYLLYIKSRVYVLNNQELRTYIIKRIYNSLFEKHVNRVSIYERDSRYYYWLKITNSIAQYVRNYYICKRIKSYRKEKQDLLKLLSISNRY